jgi:hypothetical protein
LTKNNSIPPKSISSKIAKNGEVRPFKRNNKYEIANSPNRNPRRELFSKKVNKEKMKRNKSVRPGTKIGNWKLGIGN